MNIKIIRSGRKSIALEITKELNVLVRAPYHMTDRDIKRFVDEKSAWLEEHMCLMRAKIEAYQKQTETVEKITEEEINQLANEALIKIPERVKYFAPLVGVSYGRITIRNQVSRWGSCSAKGNLNFNCLLMLTPLDIIDYVVVHELCHRKELNHSAKFWSEVKRVIPDYAEKRKWLKENGNQLIQKLR